MRTRYKKLTEKILELAGIKINGSNPWDIRVQNDNFYSRVITEGELGMGESFMDNWWDAENVDEMIFMVLRSQLDEKIRLRFSILIKLFFSKLFNLQSRRRAFIIGEKHYDSGNNLFQIMLDDRMNYSCAYWKRAQSLNEAQENKLELICRKLYLRPGMRVK